MVLPFPKPSEAPRQGPGSDRARRVAETLLHDIAIAVARLGTADQNRVLLVVSAFIATQLEALEDSNES